MKVLELLNSDFESDSQRFFHHAFDVIIGIRPIAVIPVNIHEVGADALIHQLLLGGGTAVDDPERDKQIYASPVFGRKFIRHPTHKKPRF